MTLLTLDRGAAPADPAGAVAPAAIVPVAATDAPASTDPFPFAFEHLGREFETVMGDVTLCCSTCCTCSSGGGKQQPR